VHLVWRLSAKRRMGKHPVVFLDVALEKPPDRGDAIQRMEVEPLVFQGAPPRFDHRVRTFISQVCGTATWQFAILPSAHSTDACPRRSADLVSGNWCHRG